MKVAIMQPYVFHYLGHFQLINAVDQFVYCDDVIFIKDGWISRNKILVTGQPNLFTIPLDEATPNKFNTKTNRKRGVKLYESLLNTIELNYKKAKQFHGFSNLIKTVASC
ncbi:WbqC family protein [Sphingobacterium chungjuense]|uniref:WbqC family protein n=1 Tax=Sphingobacterium chungjuense TaxID=2675553 RepID=UPI00140726E0